MKKKMILCLGLAIATLGFAGCGNDNTNITQQNTEQVSEEAAANTVTTKWGSGGFVVDGISVQLPCTIETFTNMGYTVSEETPVSIIPYGESPTVVLENGDKRIEVVLNNYYGNDKLYKEVPVSSVSILNSLADIDFEVAGVGSGSTFDAAKAVWGEPSSEVVGDETAVYTYTTDDGALTFSVTCQDGQHISKFVYLCQEQYMYSTWEESEAEMEMN